MLTNLKSNKGVAPSFNLIALVGVVAVIGILLLANGNSVTGTVVGRSNNIGQNPACRVAIDVHLDYISDNIDNLDINAVVTNACNIGRACRGSAFQCAFTQP